MVGGVSAQPPGKDDGGRLDLVWGEDISGLQQVHRLEERVRLERTKGIKMAYRVRLERTKGIKIALRVCLERIKGIKWR